MEQESGATHHISSGDTMLLKVDRFLPSRLGRVASGQDVPTGYARDIQEIRILDTRFETFRLRSDEFVFVQKQNGILRRSRRKHYPILH